MITYLYWLLVAAAIFLALFGIGVRMGKWKPALITAPLSSWPCSASASAWASGNRRSSPPW